VEAQGRALGLTADQYYVRRANEVFRIWGGVYGADRDKLARVIVSQEGSPALDDTELSYLDQIGGKADILAVGAYIMPPRLMSWRPEGADYYEGVARMTPAEVIAAMRDDVRDRLAPLFAAHADQARRHGLVLAAYEGGQGLVMNASDPALKRAFQDRISALFIEANRDPAIASVYDDLLDAWVKAGGGPFLVFGDVQAPTPFGSWGLLEHQDQDPATAPKYRAVTDYINRHRTETSPR
jgi:hypothetical protein